jgi:hypothetical protein
LPKGHSRGRSRKDRPFLAGTPPALARRSVEPAASLKCAAPAPGAASVVLAGAGCHTGTPEHDREEVLRRDPIPEERWPAGLGKLAPVSAAEAAVGLLPKGHSRGRPRKDRPFLAGTPSVLARRPAESAARLKCVALAPGAASAVLVGIGCHAIALGYGGEKVLRRDLMPEERRPTGLSRPALIGAVESAVDLTPMSHSRGRPMEDSSYSWPPRRRGGTTRADFAVTPAASVCRSVESAASLKYVGLAPGAASVDLAGTGCHVTASEYGGVKVLPRAPPTWTSVLYSLAVGELLLFMGVSSHGGKPRANRSCISADRATCLFNLRFHLPSNTSILRLHLAWSSASRTASIARQPSMEAIMIAMFANFFILCLFSKPTLHCDILFRDTQRVSADFFAFFCEIVAGGMFNLRIQTNIGRPKFIIRFARKTVKNEQMRDQLKWPSTLILGIDS